MDIVHIIPDDKFWKPVLSIFEQTGENNIYYGIPEGDATKFIYIDSKLIKLLPYQNIKRICQEGIFDIIMFHSLPGDYYEAINLIPKEKTIIVSSWGYDIYYSQNGCPPIIPLDLYKPHTENLIYHHLTRTIIKRIKHIVKRTLFRTKYIETNKIKTLEKKKRLFILESAISRVNYWATVLPIEYSMLKQIPYFKAEYFPFLYVGINRIEPIQINFETTNLIQIGNSADPSNNHIDIIKLLIERGVHQKLLIPISYGGDEHYRYELKKFCRENYSDYELMENYIPIKEYSNKLLCCRCAVFGHIRQQAIANLNLCLKQGKKVFLYKDSISYKYYKEAGFHIYSIDNDLTPFMINEPLSMEEIHDNIALLSQRNYSTTCDRVNESLSVIRSKIKKQLT